MDDRLKPLVQRAMLEVIDYDYHSRTEMVQLGRVQPFYVMSYLKSGEALLRMEGREYVTRPGSVILIPADTKHDHIKTSAEDAVFLWWHFNFRTSWKVDLLRLFRLPVMVQLQGREAFETRFVDYLEAIRRATTLPRLIYKNAKALEVLACLLENFLPPNGGEISADVPQVFFDILDEVSTNLVANMTLGQLAERFHMSPTYISNRFKEYFGIPPIYLHRELLAERAKELLLTTALTVKEVALEMGFSDVSVFTRFFTDRVGMPPGKFKCNT